MANKLRTSTVACMLFLALAVLGSASAFAQSSPDWNRRVVSLEVFPPGAAGDLWTAHTQVSVVGFTDLADGVDASLLVQFLVNDVLTYEDHFPLAISGGPAGNCNCTSGCEPGYCDVSEFGCWCGVVIEPDVYEYESLSPGDEVIVRILASAGSVPEQYTADDQKSIVIDEETPTETLTWSVLKSCYR